MEIKKGQGLYLKISTFANGAPCEKSRPFLVIDIIEDSKVIQVLNISSTKGKESRMMYDNNLPLLKWNPPFNEPSFVKLDELYEINYNPNLKIFRNGITIDRNELSHIILEFNNYRKIKGITTIRCDAENLTSIIIKEVNDKIS